MTDASGIMKEEIYYYPFGKTRSNTGTLNVKHKFTGQEEDDETGVGLYYYGARYYEPTIGKFISPDPMEPFDTRADKTSIEFQNLQRRIENLNGTENMNIQNLQETDGLRLIDQFIAANPDYTKDGKTGEDVQKLQELNEAVLLNPQRLNRYAYVGNNPVNRKDPLGLTWLEYIPTSGTLYVHPGTADTQGPPSAAFFATNNAASNSRGDWVPGTYDFSYWVPHSGDGANSRYGSNGNFVFDVPGCEGCGVHSGRANSCDKANRCGTAFATMGCIRTTDEATSYLKNIYQQNIDPIYFLIVRPGGY